VKTNEESVLAEFKTEGWSPMRNGWPDYLLVRSTADGKLEFLGLEVKCDRDQLSDEQRAMHVALLCAGIKVVAKKAVRLLPPSIPPG
jgi:hypothetical protein